MLKATSLRKSFATVQAVKELSLTISSGEILALLGPNGAGKTTTLRMLIGLTPMDHGQVEYVDRQGQHQRRLPPTEIGYLPEERGLYIDRRVLDGLIYFARLRGQEKAAAAASAQLWLERFDLWERRSDEVKTLSKGNQQKVQFISAIIHQPRLAIIDEPFSGFDPINQERMLDFLAELRNEGMAILFSAHQMDLVQRLADRIMLMSGGEVIDAGSFAEIRGRAGGSTSVEATYAIPPDPTQLDSAPGRPQVNDTRITLTPSPAHSMNDAVQWLSAQGPMTSLTAREPSLHEIYLEKLGQTP